MKNYWHVLLIITVFIFFLGSNFTYAGNLTGAWNGTVTENNKVAQFNSTAGNITVTGVVITDGNARWGIDSAAPGSVGFSNGTTNTDHFWSNPNASGHTSLQSTYWWDIHPESGTDIENPGDDKGTGYIMFFFSKPVLNPILHIDRMGGEGRIDANHVATNSIIFNLMNSDLSLTKLSGNDQFKVTGDVIGRTPYQILPYFNPEATWGSNSAGSGSVMINGIVNNVTFGWTGTGVEGVGHDGLELIWDLTDDNTPPTINATIIPNIVEPGNSTSINAKTDPDTKHIIATILGRNYNLTKGNKDTWNLQYTIPEIPDGIYNVLLTAIDQVGNIGYSILNFIVNNPPPAINNLSDHNTSYTDSDNGPGYFDQNNGNHYIIHQNNPIYKHYSIQNGKYYGTSPNNP